MSQAGINTSAEPPPSETQAASNHTPKERYHLVWRAAALTALVMAAYVWWTHNFGEGLAGFPVIASLTAGFSVAMGLLDESQKNDAKKWFARSLLSRVVLVPGCALMVVILCSRAPVIVLNQGSDPLQVVLAPAESGGDRDIELAEKGKPARFPVWASPLGRSFLLKAQGYAPKTVGVSAPIGLTISPERDLTPQVSLLVRPTWDGMVELLSGGTLHVYREESGKQKEIATEQPRARSSFLLGAAPLALPHDLVEDWRLELAGQSMSDISRANQLRSWKSPRFVKLLSASDELTPHQKLTAVVRASGGGKDLDCGSIELPEASGAIADLALHSCGGSQP